ncbi:MAG: nucleotidyltransferase [Myxococcaceae bacterium]
MNRDFKDLLSEFSAKGVEFLIVGAHALAAHGHVRATKDLDIWVRPTPENAPRVVEALRSFGAPLNELTVADFSAPGVTFQIGVEPVRIDVITAIDGVEFDGAWARRLVKTFGGLAVGVISFDDLIANKKATGRLQDLADIEALQKLRG